MKKRQYILRSKPENAHQ